MSARRPRILIEPFAGHAHCQSCGLLAHVHVSVPRTGRWFRFRLCERCLTEWRDGLTAWLTPRNGTRRRRPNGH